MADSPTQQTTANTQEKRPGRFLQRGQWDVGQVISVIVTLAVGAIGVIGGCVTVYAVVDVDELTKTQQNILVSVGKLKASHKAHRKATEELLARLHLDRVGAFPLLFQNAGTVGGKLSREGVELAPGQLASWHRNLFASASWPDAATKNVAHCVVAYSSTARFQGKPKEASDELNVQAAGCRADSVAKELGTVLDEPTPVASCRWSSYDAMTRPHLQPDGHLATPDRQLISRSAFVHGFRLSEQKLPSIQEGGFDVGEACDEWMAEKLGVESSTLSCSTVDGEPPRRQRMPPKRPEPSESRTGGWLA